MKSLTSLLLALLAAPQFCAAAAELLPVRYEAEEQVLSDGAGATTDSLASGGRAVRFGDAGSIQWTVMAPEAGRYKLWLRYRAKDGDKVAGLVVNGRDLGVGFSRTGDEWAEMSLVRTLAAGSNTIVLRKDWPQLALDYLRFDFIGRSQPHPMVELPVVSPRTNIRYAGNSADTRIHVELGGHQLLGIRERDRKLNFAQERCDYLDDAIRVRLAAAELSRLKPGAHELTLQFDRGLEVPFELEVRQRPEKYPWTIVTLDVNHGSATFMRLPGGQTLLLDTAKVEEADRVVIPFLESNRVAQLDCVIITHYHDDHVGGLPAIQKRVKIGQQWDYKSFKVGDDFEVGGVKVKVLNAFESGLDENTRSLALRFEYRGFVYTHGADNYAINQIHQLARFSPDTLRAHVYHANHHFHGSVDAGFLRTMDPALVLVSAERAVYARGAFTTVFQQDVENYLKCANGRFREALVTHDVGHIVLRITDADHWTCETTPALAGIVLR